MNQILDRGRTLVLAGVIAVVVAGCGGGAAGTSPGAPAAGGGGASPAAGAGAGGAANADDMCSLLTSDDVQASAGLSVTGSGHGDMDAAHYCEWQLEPGTNSSGVSFKRLVAITKFAGASSYDVMSQGASPVAGVGDKAVVIDHNVMVLKGDTHFGVVVILHEPGDEDTTLLSKEEQVSKDLAKKAADRL